MKIPYAGFSKIRSHIILGTIAAMYELELWHEYSSIILLHSVGILHFLHGWGECVDIVRA